MCLFFFLFFVRGNRKKKEKRKEKNESIYLRGLTFSPFCFRWNCCAIIIQFCLFVFCCETKSKKSNRQNALSLSIVTIGCVECFLHVVRVVNWLTEKRPPLWNFLYIRMTCENCVLWCSFKLFKKKSCDASFSSSSVSEPPRSDGDRGKLRVGQKKRVRTEWAGFISVYEKECVTF
ncbi:hypothetical protein INR49_019987 [Caranx melampygus]|nr:hypothetical protein INR49_019987 [Caranx melampygus]